MMWNPEPIDDVCVRQLPLIAVISSALLLGSLSRVQAQIPEAEASPESAPFFGIWLARESLPGAVDPVCGEAVDRRRRSVFGGFVVVPVGRLGLEGRASRHSGGPDFVCSGPIADRNGTFTDHSVDVAAGDFMTIDLRLRLAGGSHSWWVLALGAGWAASSKRLPYLTSSVGVRVGAGAGVRGGVDLEMNSYRVPWTALTAEYEGGSIVTVTNDRPYKEWATSFGLRFTLEVPVNHGG